MIITISQGTEKPTEELLERLPYRRDAGLVSRVMWKHIFVQVIIYQTYTPNSSLYSLSLLSLSLPLSPLLYSISHLLSPPFSLSFSLTYSLPLSPLLYSISHLLSPALPPSLFHFSLTLSLSLFRIQAIYQIIICMLLLFEGPKWFAGFGVNENQCFNPEGCEGEPTDYTKNTVIFNAFVFMQLFNEINARSITTEWNVYRGKTSRYNTNPNAHANTTTFATARDWS